MAKQQSMDASFTPEDIGLPETVEAAVITSPTVPTPLEVNRVNVHFSCLVANPTAGAQYYIRLYRGNSLAGQQVYNPGVINPNAAAAAMIPLAVDFAETLSGTDFTQYTASVEMVTVATSSSLYNPFIRVESV